MIKNYFKIAWRNLVKNKTNSFINIAGLSVGMAVALLIGLWVWDELSYNKNFNNYDQIVRLKENSTSGDVHTLNTVPIPLAIDLQTKFNTDFSGVSLASNAEQHVFAYGEKKLGENGLFVQPAFAKIFSLNMIKGSWHSLDDLSSIVLSQTLAKTIFGDEDPINKLIKFDNHKSLKVSGVYTDFPHNSEFNDITYFIPWDFYVADQPWVQRSETKWNNNSFQVFAALQNGVSLQKAQANVTGELNGHERVDKPEVLLQPINKWHLYNEFKDGKNTGGAIQYVWMFGITGFFVLMLACINFMNLSTARSEKRAKEVGIRKAIGSLRKQLILQFLSESLLMAFMAFIVAMVMVALALPWFNRLADKDLSILWTNAWFWLAAISFTFFTGIIAGSYPAFYLSSFNSVKVLKGTFKAGPLAAIPRKILVVFQFTISIALIIATIIIYKEIQFAKDRPIGYSREGLVTVNMNSPDLARKYDILRNDLINSGGVIEMGESSSRTTEVSNYQGYFNWKGKDPGLNPSFGSISVTTDFGKTVGWQFKEGRDFSRDFKTDTASIVVNESAAKFMGLTNPVGETVSHEVDGKIANYKIIGVINDMVMESPFDPIRPCIYFLNPGDAYRIIVKLNPGLSASQSLPKIEAVFKKYNPGAPFDYRFADDEYAKKFATDERVSSIATVFAVFTIFISCIGLFGLASFTAEQRTKEIGVRKVLGASVFSVWQLLSKEFLLMILTALFIATPLAYYFMHSWLQHYQYRTEITWWIFAMTALGAIILTLATVSYQSIKAALANPVRSLKIE